MKVHPIYDIVIVVFEKVIATSELSSKEALYFRTSKDAPFKRVSWKNYFTIALNQLPEGPDGPDPPDGAGTTCYQAYTSGWRSGGQDKAIDTPTTLLPILQVQILQDKTTM